MTFANCPKCGSSNVTTAGVCANCGWTRFPQVMGAGESEEAVYELVGEIEIKVTGKALLDDYKRLLLENRNLNARIAELEGENKKAFDFVKTLRTYCVYAHWDNPDAEGEFNEFDAEICKWLSEFTERER